MVFDRTSGQPGRIDGISCFLVDADTPGFEVGDIHRPMGHAWVAPSELELDDCRVGEDALLGEEGKGSTKRWTGSVTRGWASPPGVSARPNSSSRRPSTMPKSEDVDVRQPLIDRQGNFVSAPEV